MKLKVCGNTNPENMQRLIELNPDYLGFIFYPGSKRFIGYDENIRRFVASVDEVKKTGVFVNTTLEKVKTCIAAYKLDLVQLHGTESPEYCKELSKSIPVIKAFGISPDFDFATTIAYENNCSYFLFDTACPEYGGSGITFDWSVLQRYRGVTPFFLSGGIGMVHLPVIQSMQHPSLMGVDVNSRFEITPGIKNINRLKTFIHALRNQ